MKVLVVHLGDIHLKSNTDSIFQKAKKIASAISGNVQEHRAILFIVAGDLAYSGKIDEYRSFIKLFESIKGSIEPSKRRDYYLITVPGNHDCDFEIKTGTRPVILKHIKDGEIVNAEIIDEATSVQANYFSFVSKINQPIEVLSESPLVSQLQVQIEGKSIAFNCFNSAWCSELHERAGTMRFPIQHLRDTLKEVKADLQISIVHHPFNWLEPTIKREFEDILTKKSDLIFTGHEHVDSLKVVDTVDKGIVEYIEGNVLQDSKYGDISGFNLISIDLLNNNHEVYNYQWVGTRYTVKNDVVQRELHKKVEKKEHVFPIKPEFQNFLKDLGATVNHSKKREPLTLKDIFLYPDLKILNSNNEKVEHVSKIISSSSLVALTSFKLLLTGDENIGKTTLVKVLFEKFFDQGYVPVLIDGGEIKSNSYGQLLRLSHKKFIQQYSQVVSEDFKQLDESKKVIIIDSFHTAKLNVNQKSELLTTIERGSENFIITGDDFLHILDLIYSGREGVEEKMESADSFDHYEILSFGHVLRSALVKRWLEFDSQVLEPEKFYKIHDTYISVINTALGKGFVPSYPIFLMVLLQNMDTERGLNLETSLYGHYYEYLINGALVKSIQNNTEIDYYVTFLKEVAFKMFESSFLEITLSELEGFVEWFKVEYDNPIDLNHTLKTLQTAGILEQTQNGLRFKHKYAYYYFVAKYLADNMNLESTRVLIRKLTDRLFNEEFANIIMFLTHLEKDPFVFETVLDTSKNIFKDLEPAQFDEDISVINRMVPEGFGKLVLEDKSVDEVRQEENRRKDAQMEIEDVEDLNGKDYGIDEDISNLDILLRINRATRMLNILGQMVKKYGGSLKAKQKLDLARETYDLGLRSVKVFFNELGDDESILLGEIKEWLNKDENVSELEIEEKAKEMAFGIYHLLSYSFVRKTSMAIGTEYLSTSFRKLIEENPTNAYLLIDLSIKLDHFSDFPLNQVKDLKKKFSSNALCYHLLKRLVLRYLYMVPTKFDQRQRISELLDIPVATARVAQQSTKR